MKENNLISIILLIVLINSLLFSVFSKVIIGGIIHPVQVKIVYTSGDKAKLNNLIYFEKSSTYTPFLQFSIPCILSDNESVSSIESFKGSVRYCYSSTLCDHVEINEGNVHIDNGGFMDMIVNFVNWNDGKPIYIKKLGDIPFNYWNGTAYVTYNLSYLSVLIDLSHADFIKILNNSKYKEIIIDFNEIKVKDSKGNIRTCKPIKVIINVNYTFLNTLNNLQPVAKESSAELKVYLLFPKLKFVKVDTNKIKRILFLRAYYNVTSYDCQISSNGIYCENSTKIVADDPSIAFGLITVGRTNKRTYLIYEEQPNEYTSDEINTIVNAIKNELVSEGSDDVIEYSFTYNKSYLLRGNENISGFKTLTLLAFCSDSAATGIYTLNLEDIKNFSEYVCNVSNKVKLFPEEQMYEIGINTPLGPDNNWKTIKYLYMKIYVINTSAYNIDFDNANYKLFIYATQTWPKEAKVKIERPAQIFTSNIPFSTSIPSGEYTLDAAGISSYLSILRSFNPEFEQEVKKYLTNARDELGIYTFGRVIDLKPNVIKLNDGIVILIYGFNVSYKGTTPSNVHFITMVIDSSNLDDSIKLFASMFVLDTLLNINTITYGKTELLMDYRVVFQPYPWSPGNEKLYVLSFIPGEYSKKVEIELPLLYTVPLKKLAEKGFYITFKIWQAAREFLDQERISHSIFTRIYRHVIVPQIVSGALRDMKELVGDKQLVKDFEKFFKSLEDFGIPSKTDKVKKLSKRLLKIEDNELEDKEYNKYLNRQKQIAGELAEMLKDLDPEKAYDLYLDLNNPNSMLYQRMKEYERLKEQLETLKNDWNAFIKVLNDHWDKISGWLPGCGSVDDCNIYDILNVLKTHEDEAQDILQDLSKFGLTEVKSCSYVGGCTYKLKSIKDLIKDDDNILSRIFYVHKIPDSSAQEKFRYVYSGLFGDENIYTSVKDKLNKIKSDVVEKIMKNAKIEEVTDEIIKAENDLHDSLKFATINGKEIPIGVVEGKEKTLQKAIRVACLNSNLRRFGTCNEIAILIQKRFETLQEVLQKLLGPGYETDFANKILYENFIKNAVSSSKLLKLSSSIEKLYKDLQKDLKDLKKAINKKTPDPSEVKSILNKINNRLNTLSEKIDLYKIEIKSRLSVLEPLLDSCYQEYGDVDKHIIKELKSIIEDELAKSNNKLVAIQTDLLGLSSEINDPIDIINSRNKLNKYISELSDMIKDSKISTTKVLNTVRGIVKGGNAEVAMGLSRATDKLIFLKAVAKKLDIDFKYIGRAIEVIGKVIARIKAMNKWTPLRYIVKPFRSITGKISYLMHKPIGEFGILRKIRFGHVFGGAITAVLGWWATSDELNIYHERVEKIKEIAGELRSSSITNNVSAYIPVIMSFYGYSGVGIPFFISLNQIPSFHLPKFTELNLIFTKKKVLCMSGTSLLLLFTPLAIAVFLNPTAFSEKINAKAIFLHLYGTNEMPINQYLPISAQVFDYYTSDDPSEIEKLADNIILKAPAIFTALDTVVNLIDVIATIGAAATATGVGAPIGAICLAISAVLTVGWAVSGYLASCAEIVHIPLHDKINLFGKETFALSVNRINTKFDLEIKNINSNGLFSINIVMNNSALKSILKDICIYGYFGHWKNGICYAGKLFEGTKYENITQYFTDYIGPINASVLLDTGYIYGGVIYLPPVYSKNLTNYTSYKYIKFLESVYNGILNNGLPNLDTSSIDPWKLVNDTYNNSLALVTAALIIAKRDPTKLDSSVSQNQFLAYLGTAICMEAVTIRPAEIPVPSNIIKSRFVETLCEKIIDGANLDSSVKEMYHDLLKMKKQFYSPVLNIERLAPIITSEDTKIEFINDKLWVGTYNDSGKIKYLIKAPLILHLVRLTSKNIVKNITLKYINYGCGTCTWGSTTWCPCTVEEEVKIPIYKMKIKFGIDVVGYDPINYTMHSIVAEKESFIPNDQKVTFNILGKKVTFLKGEIVNVSEMNISAVKGVMTLIYTVPSQNITTEKIQRYIYNGTSVKTNITIFYSATYYPDEFIRYSILDYNATAKVFTPRPNFIKIITDPQKIKRIYEFINTKIDEINNDPRAKLIDVTYKDNGEPWIYAKDIVNRLQSLAAAHVIYDVMFGMLFNVNDKGMTFNVLAIPNNTSGELELITSKGIIDYNDKNILKNYEDIVPIDNDLFRLYPAKVGPVYLSWYRMLHISRSAEIAQNGVVFQGYLNVELKVDKQLLDYLLLQCSKKYKTCKIIVVAFPEE